MTAALGTRYEDDEPLARPLRAQGWTALVIGAGLALATQVFPLLEVLIGYFVVLVHEFGHAITGWLFGYPSIPAFDFTYGGGVTTHQDQVKLLVGVVLAGFLWLAWILRRNTLSLSLLAGWIALYVWALAGSGHEIAMLAMGHGGELLFATLFLYRAASGSGCHLAVERPLYAWIGFHILIHDWSFAHDLATSLAERAVYEEAKGGGHWMDFSRLADEFFGVPLQRVALVFQWLCLLPPLLALACHRWRSALGALGQRLIELDP